MAISPCTGDDAASPAAMALTVWCGTESACYSLLAVFRENHIHPSFRAISFDKP